MLSVSVPADAPVKLLHLRLHNASRSTRTATLTWYAELTLGDHRSHTASTIVTRLDVETGMLVADNVMSEHFGGGVLFMDTSERQRAITGDRTAFIGRNRTLATARGISSVAGGRVGAALDPCGVVQVAVTAGAPGKRARSPLCSATPPTWTPPGNWRPDSATRWRHRRQTTARVAIWDERLSRVQIRTPDAALDVMVNRWLLYQTLACRVWGRTAFYQSSGAFGFRDQLQDVLALLWVDPGLAHAQLLRAASRQFVEGDVQHWWHEPGGHGVRTRFSDDRLWMVYVALQYIDVTGDHAVLDHVVPFLAGRRLDPHEHEVYQPAHPSDEHGTLFEHCARAIDISLDSGAHGLPLMGTGDWNDGMNRVGEGGLGESVWLAWFQLAILPRFAALAEARGDLERARRYRNRVMTLETAAEAAWDGAWYRRAYFDDGTPLGSTTNAECRIDAIAQAWAVLSGHGDPERAKTAMASVDRLLVRRDSGLVLLLTPPFNRMVPSPGYIKGYVPGVRENGGQYTHAALWVVLAFAQLGDGAKAAELLSMLNPARRTATAEDLSRYRAEPYVVAADVYSQAPHTGRGGWTWYTGSASWMYRVALEGLLGVTLQGGDTLHVNPCIPPTWPGFEVTLRRPGATEYVVVVENPHGASTGVARVELDGVALDVKAVKLVGDGRRHQVRVVMGQPVLPAQNPAQPSPLRPNPVNLRG